MIDTLLALDTRWVLAGLLFAIDAWAIGLIARSRAGLSESLLWVGIVLLVPVFGPIFWYALGPKPRRA